MVYARVNRLLGLFFLSAIICSYFVCHNLYPLDGAVLIRSVILI